MADRTETVRYKIEIDTSDVPEELRPGGAKQLPGTAPPPLPSATPPPLPDEGDGESPSPRQRVHVSRVQPDHAKMVEMFARLMRMPQFSAGMADSMLGFAQRTGLGNVFAKLGVQSSVGAGGAGGAGAGGGGGLGGLMGSIPGGAMGAGIGLLLALEVKSLKEGFAMMAAGRNQMVGGALGADPSNVIKGGFHAYQGVWHAQSLGGLNPVAKGMEKLVGAMAALVDVADKLSAQFAKYNGQIAASEAMLKVSQIQANIRMGQAFAPMLTEWNKLKGHVTDITSKLAVAAGTLLSHLVAPLERGLNYVLEKLDKGLTWLLNKLGLGESKGHQFTGAGMSALLTGAIRPNSGVNIRAAIGGHLNDIVGTTKHHGLAGGGIAGVWTGGIGIPAIPFRYSKPPKPLSPPSKEAYYGEADPANAAKQAERRLADIRADRRKSRILDHYQESDKEKQKNDALESKLQKQVDTLKQQVAVQQRASAPVSFKGMDFQQHVEMNLQMQLVNQKQINDSICAVRDKLLSAFNTGRNEASLALSILNLNGGAVI